MRYAQSILELLNQLYLDGYGRSDLCLARDAYVLAMGAFTGLARPSGKLFIDHAVGTASVLHLVGAPPAITCAGLIHSIYAHGEMGRWRKGISKASRRKVEAVVGAQVEELVAGYSALRWNRATISAIATEVKAYDAVGRGVVLMHLANEVDEHLDGGVLYLPDAERRRDADMLLLPSLVTMAEELGYPILASELPRVFEETMSSTIPAWVPDGSMRAVSLQVPRSCRRSLSGLLAGVSARILRRES
jgi:hypothetical protein